MTKPGGYVLLNESTWLKVPPSPEVVAWASQDLGANVQPLIKDAWTGLMEKSGFKDIIAKIPPIDVQEEVKGVYQRYDFGGVLRIFSKTAVLYIRNPDYRRFVKSVAKAA